MIQAAFSRGSAVNFIAANGERFGGGIFARGEPVNSHYVFGEGGASSVMLVADLGSGDDLGHGAFVKTVEIKPDAPVYPVPAGAAGPDPGPAACEPPLCAAWSLKKDIAVDVSVFLNDPVSGMQATCNASVTAASDGEVYALRMQYSLELVPASIRTGSTYGCGNYSTRHAADYAGCRPDVDPFVMCQLIECSLQGTHVVCGSALPKVLPTARLASAAIDMTAGGTFDVVHFDPFAALGAAQIAPRNLTDFQVASFGYQARARLSLHSSPSSSVYGLAISAQNRSWLHATDLPR
eukprot:TRINITY_DN38975_c0_g1_i2.p1 TRINITY_DN38975_c0_g1~~TRINITY_DN38975_c0_g1_i2.p1  ORF type:complete len:294 (-),score=43.90 TRINITY_DN38975_c0_g1_i2:20-901(-)